jgi:UDP-glucose:(heptosyl)LPS alpha-1,3-glucosyltransferase
MVRRHYPRLGDDRLATLFNAVDLGRYDPAARADAGAAIRRRFQIGEKQIVALMVAQDFGRKGLAETIVALGKMNRKDLVLLVAGRDEAGPFKRAAIRNGVGERVKFAGGTNDVYAFYRAADFFVLPTRHDPCSLVVLEALAMGVPVISTKQNGACEIMGDGVHGFVLGSADDGAGLVEAMGALCDPIMRGRMKTACLSLRPRLAQEEHLDALLAVFRTVELRERERVPK